MKLPRWFQAVMVGVFLVLIGAIAVVRQGGVREAMASALVERVIKSYLPTMEQSLAMPRPVPEPPDGAYYLNGMLVEYHTLPAPIGIEAALQRFDMAFHQSGYATRMLRVLGQRTLVAIHPKTKMLLTVRPGVTAKGMATVRLSQQDLNQVNPAFRPELPDLPTIPGAKNLVMVRSAEGPQTSSLTLTVPDTRAAAIEYYKRELTARGWTTLVPPAQPPFGGLETTFFERGKDECYLLTGPGATPNEAIVMVMITEKGASS